MTPIYIDVPQGSDQWRLARAGLATASRFAAIMATTRTGGEAADRRNYRADLLVERLTGRPLDGFQTAAMRQGVEREPQSRVAFEAETGLTVRQVGMFKHPELDAAASPDGLIGERIGLELKNPERATHLRYLQTPTIPPEYEWQVQGQCWLCGLDEVYFASYNPDFPDHLQLAVRRVRRDDKAIARLDAEVRKFLGEVHAEVERLGRLAA